MEALGHAEDIDLTEALRYLTTLDDHEHTPDSVDALIQLAKNFSSLRSRDALQAASLASRLAIAWSEAIAVRSAWMEGMALSDLGRFTEAAVAHAESWRLARALGDIEREVWAIKRVGDLWEAMAQFDVAITY